MNFTTEDTPIYEEQVPIMDEEMRFFAEQIIMFLMFPLNVLGIVTNIINIRVFIEQGIKNDSTNISFLSLSLFDLFSCATAIPYNMCYIGLYTFGHEHYTCSAYSTLLLIAHVAFQHSSAWTTVYISVVRTACVVIPLKVKLMFKPKMTTILIIAIFLAFGLNHLIYSVFGNDVEYQYVPKFNTTLAFLTGSPFSRSWLYYNNIVTNQALPVLALIIVTITTSLLRYKLIEVTKWRQKTSNIKAVTTKDAEGDTGKKPIGSKDIELIKSVTTVTIIFLICLLMSFIPSSAIVFIEGVSFMGINRHLFLTCYMIRFFFDAVNSSINYFFYIRISTRYKEAFASAFPYCPSPLKTET